MKIGDRVKIRTQRPHIEQYNGCEGQITAIMNRDICYVVIGRSSPCFYMDEIELVAPPVEGGVK